MNISSNPTQFHYFPPNYFNSKSQSRIPNPILCAANRRKKRYGIARSSKLMLDSAWIIASKLRLIPEPLELLLTEFGGGNGGGNGFRWGNGGGFDGWKRSKRTKLGILGILVICGFGLWFVFGNELGLDNGDALLVGLALLLMGLTVGVWRKGAKDWVLGFCCCAFLVGLVSKKDDFRAWVRCFRDMKINGRRKRRVF